MNRETQLVNTVVERLDEMSVQLMLASTAAPEKDQWLKSLLNLANYARTASLEQIAVIADSAAVDLKHGDFSNFVPTLERAIQDMRKQLGVPELEEPVKAAGNTSETASAIPQGLAQDPELLGDFVLESREHLETIETQLLCLEQDSANMESVHSIFRSFHTIKGLAGFLEFPLIQEVAHEVETVLDHARQGALEIDARATDIILESKDYIGRWIKHLDESPSKPVPADLLNNRALIRTVQGILNASPIEESAAPEKAIVEPEIAQAQPSAEPSQSEATPAATSAAPAPTAPVAKKASESAQASGSRSVKVDTEKLDYLVDMVGELVIAESLVRHEPDLVGVQSARLTKSLSQLARITNEVQRTAMAIRMVPIGPLFQKMARLVRDLTRRFGKQATFFSSGEDVQLDRNIVEELADPLMHMVRNCVDHGLDTPEERLKADKDPIGRVELRAFHLSGQIVIQVVDDGRGIQKEKVLAKAKSKGIVAQNAILSDAECFALIFAPGFSTAEQISDVSGRGVGMDVVKKQIQKLRGSIEIESTPGKGTTFSLKLPLTLAIIDGLVVETGSERYIIPLSAVREMLRPTAQMVSTVENKAEVVVVRDRMIPVIRLYERFKIPPRTQNPTEAVFVVIELDNVSFALMVDQLVGKQEVVIKSLGRAFQGVPGVAGGAILGDGRVGLILDMQTLFGFAKIGSHIVNN